MVRISWAVLAVGSLIGLALPTAAMACPPGQGLKPTPGGFGGSSCQPLGTFNPGTQPRVNAPRGGSRGNAVAVGGAAINLLGTLLQEAERAERGRQNSGDEAARRRHAHCNAKYRRSYALNEEARRLVGSDPEAALAKFEAALNNLGGCGSRTDLAKLRNNLASTRRDLAAMERPSETGTHGTSGVGPITRSAAHLLSGARESCSQLQEGSPNQTGCIRNRVAELVMLQDASVRAACQRLADVDLRNQCAFNRHFASLYGKDPNQFGDPNNCYWNETGKPCHGRSAIVAANPPNAGSPSLRDTLRERLNAMPDHVEQPSVEQQRVAEIERAKSVRDSLPPGPERDHLTQVINQAEAGRLGDGSISTMQPAPGVGDAQQPSATPVAADSASPKAASDDAYENYVRSGNTHSGGLNSGDLLMQRGTRVGVPERGSFANDHGGDALLGSPIPSRR